MTIVPSTRAGSASCADVERMADGAHAVIAGWPVARQHPKGRDGTVFVTIEDETGDAQAILWPDVHRRYRRELSSQVVVISGEVSRYDGAPNLTASEIRVLRSPARMPELARLAVMIRRFSSCEEFLRRLEEPEEGG